MQNKEMGGGGTWKPSFALRYRCLHSLSLTARDWPLVPPSAADVHPRLRQRHSKQREILRFGFPRRLSKRPDQAAAETREGAGNGNRRRRV